MPNLQFLYFQKKEKRIIVFLLSSYSRNLHARAFLFAHERRPKSTCSKAHKANLGLVKKFNCYLITVKEGFFTRLWFKEKKFVIYNLLEPQFCGKPSFSG